MSTHTNTTLPQDIRSGKSLTEVLDQSERIKDAVEECAEELSSVNSIFKQEFDHRHILPQVESALEKSATVESKVQDAAEELSIVNRALECEIRERQVLEHQLDAAKKQEEAARHTAFHDTLTGLPNRVLFNDRLEHGLAQAKRHGWALAVMFLDLNHFKEINDSHGHDVGDCVLQIISQRLKENTREDDTVSRHGGDEFLYLLMEVPDEADVAAIAEKIIRAIREPCEVNIGYPALSLSIGASIGISLFPKNGVTAELLIKNADKAMYQAKRTGSGYAFAEGADDPCIPLS